MITYIWGLVSKCPWDESRDYLYDMHSCDFPNMHTKWCYENNLIITGLWVYFLCTWDSRNNCSWDSSRNNFLWHTFGVIPKIPTKRQQWINIHDKHSGVILKIPTRWQQRKRTLLHTLWYFSKMHTRCAQKLIFHNDLHSSIIPRNAYQMAEEIKFLRWHTLGYYFQNAYKITADYNFSWYALCVIFKIPRTDDRE